MLIRQYPYWCAGILIAMLVILSLARCAEAQTIMIPPGAGGWPHWGVARRWFGDQMLMPHSTSPSLRDYPRFFQHGPYYMNERWYRGGGYPYRWGGDCYGNWRCGY
jgi:hypothetical protein